MDTSVAPVPRSASSVDKRSLGATVARRDLETALALPAVDDEQGDPDDSETRPDVDEQGIPIICEPRDGTYGHERPDDDSDDGQDVSQRVELQLPEALRDLPALGSIFGHADSVPDHKERRPMPADRSAIGHAAVWLKVRTRSGGPVEYVHASVNSFIYARHCS
jgi:hypothetical protein